MKNSLNNGFNSFEKENRLVFKGRMERKREKIASEVEEMILKDNPELAKKYSPEGLAKAAQKKADAEVAKAGDMSFADMAKKGVVYRGKNDKAETFLGRKGSRDSELGKLKISPEGSGIVSKEQVPAYVSDPLDYAQNHLGMLNDVMMSSGSSDEAFSKASDALVFLAGRSGETGELARQSLRQLAGQAVEVAQNPKRQAEAGFHILDLGAFTRATREVRSSLDDFDKIKSPKEKDIAKLQSEIVKNLKVMQGDRLQIME